MVGRSVVGDDRKRAISTVMDVSLALLIISATVLLIGVFLHADDDPIDDDRGDRAYQTLSGSTVTISYNLTVENESGHAPIDSGYFSNPDGLDPKETPELYTITTYDAAPALLTEATLVNVTYDGDQPLAYADTVEDSVDAAIRGKLVGADDSVYAVATWEPYENASINGTATAGEQPPRTTDISSTSTTVSTSMAGAETEPLAETFYEGKETQGDGVENLSLALSDRIIEAMFPIAETQYTLESTLTENAVTTYDYRKLALAFDDEDRVDDINESITGTKPNTEEANAELTDALADSIEDDIVDDPIADDLNQTYAEHGGDKEAFVAAAEPTITAYVSVETVDITVQATER